MGDAGLVMEEGFGPDGWSVTSDSAGGRNDALAEGGVGEIVEVNVSASHVTISCDCGNFYSSI